MQKADNYYVGVDVGTGSVRAGVFDRDGVCLGSAAHDITIFRSGADIVEQSSQNIWDRVCQSVRQAVAEARINPLDVSGIGFDATCSLVVVDTKGKPLTVSLSGKNSRNVIVWMDHRAIDQAERINATGHRVLDYVGGRISPEMETPKLLWLKENLPDTYHNAGHFFDLADFLTWWATGDLSRSVCTVTCKWTYLAHEKAWDRSYFETIGLADLADEDFARIGQSVVDVGTPLGNGLAADAAKELGLEPGTAVGAGLIDAHAGGIGTIGAAGPHEGPMARMAYVFGTSACTMSSSAEKAFVPGVWGPYYSAMVPGLWLSEGGQSAAGHAIAQLVRFHPAYPFAQQTAQKAGCGILDYLLQKVAEKTTSLSDAALLANDIVVVPEFLGNRAPFADPEAKAVISGLAHDETEDSLIALYVAGILGLGYGLRQILNVQRANGVRPELVVISGGAGAHPIVKQLLADAADISFAEPGTAEPVLLGSAMLGAVAAGQFGSVQSAMQAMSRLGAQYTAVDGELRALHERRFVAFEALQQGARTARGAA